MLRKLRRVAGRVARCGLALCAGTLIQVSFLSGRASAHHDPGSLDPSWAVNEYTHQTREGREDLPLYDGQTDAVEDVVRPSLDQSGLFLVAGGVAITFLAGLVLHLCRRHRRRTMATACLQAELTKAQLQAMKAQLQPHFLFNTLNTISVLVTENPAKANRMIMLLSDLLRQTVEMSQADEVTLRRELELLRAYIEIQRMRFKRRLSVSYEVNADILDAKLPNFTLQPIVENAIRHGIAKQRGGGRIEIRAHKLNGSLVLQVQDDGPGLSLEQMRERNGNGVGLANTSKRLSCIYGSSSSFKIQSRRPKGTVATIVIPFHESGKQP